jgi:hypothetical protein
MESHPTVKAPPVCAECGREPRNDENADDEWRAYRDIDDDLPCSARSAPSASSARPVCLCWRCAVPVDAGGAVTIF